jgi:hypothetical protein
VGRAYRGKRHVWGGQVGLVSRLFRTSEDGQGLPNQATALDARVVVVVGSECLCHLPLFQAKNHLRSKGYAEATRFGCQSMES